MNPPRIGEMVKVWLPGETPWAECMVVYPDGSWDGKIANTLVAERSEFERAKIVRDFFPGSRAQPLRSLHSYKSGQVVRWHWADPTGSGHPCWCPVSSPSGGSPA